MAKNFIGIYNNAMSSDKCNKLITFIETCGKLTEGIVAVSGGNNKVDSSIKESLEVSDTKFSDNTYVSNIISHALSPCLDAYVKEYYSLKEQNFWGIVDGYTVKKFEGENAGYKKWHCEHGSLSNRSKRILVWSFYLNNAKSGTEFMHFPTIRARMGRCVIFPAAWTHTHRSAPNKGIKYYVSGWISYE